MARTREEEVLERLKEHSLKISDDEVEFIKLSTRVSVLEKLILLGEGDRKPLVEVIRNLEAQVNSFIAKQNAREQEALDDRKFVRRTIIAGLITLTITTIIPSIITVFVLLARIQPLLESMK